MFSAPLLVAVMTTRLAFSRDAREPPLALVVFTINWRLEGMWSQSAAISSAAMVARADTRHTAPDELANDSEVHIHQGRWL